MVALSSKYGNVVGFDVSMESLIYAKKLLEENKCNNVKIFCSGINSLPFPDNSFDVVSASNVIEHIQDQRGAIEEIHRVQKTGGIFFGDIPNRYTLKPEPHVNIRFVGFLPRRLAHKYVMFRRNRSYEGYNLPSYYDIINLFEPTYGVDNLKVRSFYEITDAIKKFLNIRFKHTSAIRRIGSFFCHYFFVIARKG